MSAALPPQVLIETQVSAALAEDLGGGDCSAQLIAADRHVEARLLCREAAILCGRAWVDECFRQLGGNVTLRWQFEDGDPVDADQVLCQLSGPARTLLSGERTALNFLQTLSGTATVTRRYVAAVEGHPVRILDTRKTLPCLRAAQKYAVRCGGGHNHRMGLYDAFLIKENHIEACGSLSEAVAQARRQDAGLLLEVEVENLAQLDEAIDAGADRVLLDNFSPADLREARARARGHLQLEASGGIDLDNIAHIAASGVDYISVGALTKHVRAIDLSLRFEA